MPEEFRLWKERVEEVQKKKSTVSEQSSDAVPSTSVEISFNEVTPTADTKIIPKESYPKKTSNALDDVSLPDSQLHPVLPTYNTREEMVDAFISLLNDKEISSTMKFKDALTICQHDIRWNALKTVGERKQTLAEFQSKKMKADKELKKATARKCRDMFFQMLAENTDIDAKSRWRDVQVLLQEDFRFKSVEESHDREEYFNDFVQELEKKEREDRTKLVDQALILFKSALEVALNDGKISRRAIWADIRDSLEEYFIAPDLIVLDDNDRRRSFQDFVSKIEATFKEEERKKKEESLRMISVLKVRS